MGNTWEKNRVKTKERACTIKCWLYARIGEAEYNESHL